MLGHPLQRLGLMVELARVLAVLPAVEIGRRRVGPKPLLVRFRRRGSRRAKRSAMARQRLQRAIDGVDRRLPGGPNCYRRALLEIALDPDAAAEPFQMGFHVGDGPEPGHAWIGHRGGRAEDYDTVIVL